MGKTFVEDERPCDSCVNVTRYGSVSWNCEYINRDEAIKAWKEKHETADHKTEPTGDNLSPVDKDINVRSNSSEKPNNCKHITEDGVTCAKYPACDDCLDNPLNKVKGSERLLKGSEQTDLVEDSPSLVKDLVKAFGEDGTWLERQGVYTLTLAEAKQRAVDIIESVLAKDEPTISKMEQVETMSCQECKHWDVYKGCRERVCKYEPKDEPQTIKVGTATDSVTGKVLGVTLDTDCAWRKGE